MLAKPKIRLQLLNGWHITGLPSRTRMNGLRRDGIRIPRRGNGSSRRSGEYESLRKLFSDPSMAVSRDGVGSSYYFCFVDVTSFSIVLYWAFQRPCLFKSIAVYSSIDVLATGYDDDVDVGVGGRSRIGSSCCGKMGNRDIEKLWDFPFEKEKYVGTWGEIDLRIYSNGVFNIFFGHSPWIYIGITFSQISQRIRTIHSFRNY